MMNQRVAAPVVSGVLERQKNNNNAHSWNLSFLSCESVQPSHCNGYDAILPEWVTGWQDEVPTPEYITLNLYPGV